MTHSDERFMISSLYGGIAFLSVLVPRLASIENKYSLSEVQWEWASIVFLGPILTALIAIRAFLDKTKTMADRTDLPAKNCSRVLLYGFIAYLSAIVPLFTNFLTSPHWAAFLLTPLLPAAVAIRAYLDPNPVAPMPDIEQEVVQVEEVGMPRIWEGVQADAYEHCVYLTVLALLVVVLTVAVAIFAFFVKDLMISSITLIVVQFVAILYALLSIYCSMHSLNYACI